MSNTISSIKLLKRFFNKNGHHFGEISIIEVGENLYNVFGRVGVDGFVKDIHILNKKIVVDKRANTDGLHNYLLKCGFSYEDVEIGKTFRRVYEKSNKTQALFDTLRTLPEKELFGLYRSLVRLTNEIRITAALRSVDPLKDSEEKYKIPVEYAAPKQKLEAKYSKWRKALFDCHHI